MKTMIIVHYFGYERTVKGLSMRIMLFFFFLKKKLLPVLFEFRMHR